MNFERKDFLFHFNFERTLKRFFSNSLEEKIFFYFYFCKQGKKFSPILLILTVALFKPLRDKNEREMQIK